VNAAGDRDYRRRLLGARRSPLASRLPPCSRWDARGRSRAMSRASSSMARSAGRQHANCHGAPGSSGRPSLRNQTDGASATPTLQIARHDNPDRAAFLTSQTRWTNLHTEGSDADFNVRFTLAPVVAHRPRNPVRRHEQFTPLGFCSPPVPTLAEFAAPLRARSDSSGDDVMC
jgi:hypothetical protein